MSIYMQITCQSIFILYNNSTCNNTSIGNYKIIKFTIHVKQYFHTQHNNYTYQYNHILQTIISIREFYSLTFIMLVKTNKII